ncbi:MAG: CYTH domain-containing protein [Candidatus Latescibacteria bacterium]|nr:CYTH domain-containing protein [Candidatus Latescibacterota bacterium]
MPIETEIKFTVHSMDDLDRLAVLDEIAGFALDAGKTLNILDTCFDTPDLLFFREKIVFRHRRKNDRSVLTFKAQGPAGYENDGIYRRIEVEAPTTLTPNDITSGCRTDHPALAALRERVGDVPIAPSLTVRNRRRLRNLVGGGEALFEMALDDVEFSGPNGKRPVCELEVEKLSGSDDDLVRIAAWLGEHSKLEPAGSSKYILGMTLVGGMKR